MKKKDTIILGTPNIETPTSSKRLYPTHFDFGWGRPWLSPESPEIFVYFLSVSRINSETFFIVEI